MAADDSYYADHEIFLPRNVSYQGVRPIVHDGDGLVFGAEGSYWCDPLSVVAGQDSDASYHAVVREFDEKSKGKPFEVCGHTLRVGVGQRPAWADEVAQLDVSEPIWKIIETENDRSYLRRDFAIDDSSYWVGIGSCRKCEEGLVAAVTTPQADVVFVCSLCMAAWSTPLDVRQGVNGRLVGPPDELVLATAREVANGQAERRKILLCADVLDDRNLDHVQYELWTIRPREELTRTGSHFL